MSKKASPPAGDSFSLSPILAALRKRVPKAFHAEAEAFAQVFYRHMEDRKSVV